MDWHSRWSGDWWRWFLYSSRVQEKYFWLFWKCKSWLFPEFRSGRESDHTNQSSRRSEAETLIRRSVCPWWCSHGFGGSSRSIFSASGMILTYKQSPNHTQSIVFTKVSLIENGLQNLTWISKSQISIFVELSDRILGFVFFPFNT